MRETVIHARGLCRRFGDALAVDGLDLDVAAGECLGLLGPNGAGKSTTVRMLSTLLRPSAGELRVLGLDPVSQGRALRARLGVVPQETGLYGHLSAEENLRLFARLYELSGDAVRRAVARGVELAGLGERAGDVVRTYSGGMKRRLNVALALVHEPELVFLDEPTVGVDPQSRNRIFEMVDQLCAGGTTVVYTSHQLGEVERLCNRIVILDRGRKVAQGSLAELQGLQEVRKERGATLRFADRVTAARALELVSAADLAGLLEEDVPDLEAIFLALTGRALRDEVHP